MYSLYKDGGYDIAEKFKAGIFVLSNNMSFDEISAKLQIGTLKEEQKLLIREGDTQSDIAMTLDGLGIVGYDEFMTACNTVMLGLSFFGRCAIRGRI